MEMQFNTDRLTWKILSCPTATITLGDDGKLYYSQEGPERAVPDDIKEASRYNPKSSIIKVDTVIDLLSNRGLIFHQIEELVI